MSDYRSLYEEEEPSPRPRSRWLGGLIVGLILGGGIGFYLGSGANLDRGGFAESMRAPFASEGIVVLVAVIAAAVVGALKRARMATNGGDDMQAVRARMSLMILAVVLALVIGMFFFMGR